MLRRCGQFSCRTPTAPPLSRNATRFSPTSLTRSGSLSGLGICADVQTGSQYLRITLPIGVPGPTRVIRSFSSRLSIVHLRAVAPDNVYEATGGLLSSVGRCHRLRSPSSIEVSGCRKSRDESVPGKGRRSHRRRPWHRARPRLAFAAAGASVVVNDLGVNYAGEREASSPADESSSKYALRAATPSRTTTMLLIGAGRKDC